MKKKMYSKNLIDKFIWNSENIIKQLKESRKEGKIKNQKELKTQ